MAELPKPISEFILELTEDIRSPAYMLVSDANTLSEWGGDWASYYITGLQKDSDVGEHVPFLEGMLPLEMRNLFLPNVQTGYEQYADVYIFKREEGTWVLLLDATVDASRQQRLQQKSNDLSLQVVELEREEEALQETQSILEQSVRERTAELALTNAQLRKELNERKRIEDALRESEARFRRLSDSNMIGIMFWNMKGRITEANDAFLNMLGYTREDLVTDDIQWDQLTPPEGNSLDEKAFDQMRAAGACVPFKRQFIRKDGGRTTLLFGAALLTGSQNKIVCFTLDLSQYK
ncbi:MAG: PAS domain-containing protein [Pyrinomonadaceae bacterium]